MSTKSSKPVWSTFRFDDFVENVREQVMPTSKDSEHYVGLEHLDAGSLLVSRWGTDVDLVGQKFRMKKGDLLFARRNAYLRRIAIAPHDGLFSAHGSVFRPKGKHVLAEFLPFFLQSDMFMERAIAISVGSLSPTINWSTLRLQEFPLPPIEEQKRIAEILWAADDTMESYKSALSHLSALKNLTLRVSLGHDSAKVVNCAELYLSSPRNGISPKTNASGKGAPTLSIGAVRHGEVNASGYTKYAAISPSDLEKYRLQRGDILVVRGNGNKSLCGRAGIVTDVPVDCFYPDLLIRIAFDRNVILPEFAVAQWNDPNTHSHLLSYAKSTNGIWKINGRDLRQHQLVVPSMKVQKKIVERLSRFIQIERELTQHIDVVQSIKQKMANDMIAGVANVRL